MLKRLVMAFSSTPVGVAIAKVVAAPYDPFVYKLTRGRFTMAGPAVIPQLILTTVGRKSGIEREVMLAYTKDADDYLLVASNFGGEKHPAWSYNLQANPRATVLLDGEVFAVDAQLLSDAERDEVWPAIVENVTNYAKYKQRTSRSIKVFRVRLDEHGAAAPD